ncbi:restriction endonuclease, partial [Vibrio parahaemolyticus]
ENPSCGWFYRRKPDDFKKIPGSPIAYWINDDVRSLFTKFPCVSDNYSVAVGLQTSDNNRFARLWHEISLDDFANHVDEYDSSKKWYPYNKGGEYRKWYGNHEYVVNWENEGYEIKNYVDSNGKQKSRPQNIGKYFLPHISWSKISSGNFNCRYFQKN